MFSRFWKLFCDWSISLSLSIYCFRLSHAPNIFLPPFSILWVLRSIFQLLSVLFTLSIPFYPLFCIFYTLFTHLFQLVLNSKLFAMIVNYLYFLIFVKLFLTRLFLLLCHFHFDLLYIYYPLFSVPVLCAFLYDVLAFFTIFQFIRSCRCFSTWVYPDGGYNIDFHFKRLVCTFKCISTISFHRFSWKWVDQPRYALLFRYPK